MSKNRRKIKRIPKERSKKQKNPNREKETKR
jgi:hypothetical protein